MSSPAAKPKQINWNSRGDVERAVQEHLTQLDEDLQSARATGENSWQTIYKRGNPRANMRDKVVNKLKDKWTNSEMEPEERQGYYSLKLRLAYVQKNLVHIAEKRETVMKIVKETKEWESLLKSVLPTMAWFDEHIPLVDNTKLVLWFEANLIFVLTHAGHKLSTYWKEVKALKVRWENLRFSGELSADELNLVNKLHEWANDMIKAGDSATELKTFEDYHKAAGEKQQSASLLRVNDASSSSSGQNPAGPTSQPKNEAQNPKRQRTRTPGSRSTSPAFANKSNAGKGRGKGATSRPE